MANDNKNDFEEVFRFRKGSPFEQPFIAFLSAIVGSELIFLPEVTFRQVFDKKHSIIFPTNWSSRLFVRLHDARKIVLSSMLKIESNLIISVTQQLVIICYALVEDCDDGSTEFDFFRHLRNACAHGNKFTFINLRKRRKVTGLPARWREAEITLDFEGQRAIPNFMEPTDVLVLLYLRVNLL